MLVAATAALAGAITAGASPPAGLDDFFRLDVTSVDLLEVGAERASVVVHATVLSRQRVVVREFSIVELKVNGVPAYASPVRRRIELPAGQATTFEPVPVELYYRDLETLEPLRRAVDDQLMRVTATVRLIVDLNWLGRLALWARNGQVVVPVSATVPVSVPGGLVGRAGARAALRMLEPAWSLNSAIRQRQDRRAWHSSVVSLYRPSLAVVRNKLRLDSTSGESTPLLIAGTAVALSRDTLALPAELLQPWMFDPDLSRAVQKGTVTVEFTPGIEVLISGGDARPPLRLTQAAGQLRVLARGCRQRSVLAMGPDEKPHRTKVCSALDADSVALIQLIGAGTPALQPLPPAPPAIETGARWPELVLFRLHDPLSDTPVWDLLPAAGQAGDGALNLDSPFDSTAFGSPIVAPAGWLGLLLDEQHALPVSGILARFQSKSRSRP